MRLERTSKKSTHRFDLWLGLLVGVAEWLWNLWARTCSLRLRGILHVHLATCAVGGSYAISFRTLILLQGLPKVAMQLGFGAAESGGSSSDLELRTTGHVVTTRGITVLCVNMCAYLLHTLHARDIVVAGISKGSVKAVHDSSKSLRHCLFGMRLELINKACECATNRHPACTHVFGHERGGIVGHRLGCVRVIGLSRLSSALELATDASRGPGGGGDPEGTWVSDIATDNADGGVLAGEVLLLSVSRVEPRRRKIVSNFQIFRLHA